MNKFCDPLDGDFMTLRDEIESMYQKAKIKAEDGMIARALMIDSHPTSYIKGLPPITLILTDSS